MKLKNLITVCATSLVLAGLTVFAWVKAPQSYSTSERRSLAQLPKPAVASLSNGRFMSDFEDYSMDQFPLRDSFRTLKAFVLKNLFFQQDHHGLYTVNGYLSKLEYPANEARMQRSIRKMNEVIHNYVNGTKCNVYLSIIPDKNRYLAPLGSYPSIDYDAFISAIQNGVEADTYVDITPLVSLSDFYRTDQHWKQETLTDIAESIGSAMEPGFTCRMEDYSLVTIEHPFYGAYVGQAALPAEPDTIQYLTNELLESCTVTSYNTGKAQPAAMYDLSKACGRDPYEMFLSGSDPLLVIENPAQHNGKHLVVFRDSFGSSIIPLLVHGYETITIVDLRYINSAMLGSFLELKDQDVLFLYSTLILNNSISQ